MTVEDSRLQMARPLSSVPSMSSEEARGSNTVSVSPLQFINHGKFRGFRDTRGLRCINKSCQAQGHAHCNYCKVLPYVSSNLRCVTRSSSLESSTRSSPDYVFIKPVSLDNRLGNLLEELQKIQEGSENALRNGTTAKSWPSMNTLPLSRARERLSRMKHRIWTKEDICRLDGIFIKRTTRSLNRVFFTSKKSTSSSNYS